MTERPNICPTDSRHTHGRAFCSECFQPRTCGGGASERLLKCSHCGVRTLHIVSGEKNRNDPYDYGVTAPRPRLDAPRADAQQLEPEAVLKAIGVRPVYVETLGLDALILLKHHLLLVDADLSPERMARVVEQALTAALGRTEDDAD
jgi:hypothetical protein